MSRKDALLAQDRLDLLLEALEALDLVEDMTAWVTPCEVVVEVLAPFEGIRKRLQAALDETLSDRGGSPPD